jgi:Ca2+-binding EF-hand superfamily protein
MGTAHSSEAAHGMTSPLTVGELNALLAATHYREHEVQQLYSQFIAEVPSGVVPRSQFVVFGVALGITQPVMAELIFNAFDLNADGMITVTEFIKGMSTMTRGSPEEKVHFSFRMYDLQRQGYLTKAGMLQLAQSLEALQGVPLMSYPTPATTGNPHHGSKMTPAQAVERMFQESGANNQQDGNRLTFNRYKDFCRRNEAVQAGLGFV